MLNEQIYCYLPSMYLIHICHSFLLLATLATKIHVFFCIKGRVMGPLLVFVSPCFRENVIVTCKIVPFLCSLDNFLLKNVIAVFFWKSNVKMALISKMGYL